MKTWFQAAATVAAVLAAGFAQAQQAQPKAAGAVESRLEARRIVTAADGKETFASAEAAKPGDVIEYVATYRNTTRQPVRNLQATLPIPDGMDFVPGTQKPAEATASLDGSRFAAMPLRRKVERSGASVDELVAPREYRALRWSTQELAAEKSVAFTARARIRDEPATGPPTTSGGGR